MEEAQFEQVMMLKARGGSKIRGPSIKDGKDSRHRPRLPIPTCLECHKMFGLCTCKDTPIHRIPHDRSDNNRSSTD